MPPQNQPDIYKKIGSAIKSIRTEKGLKLQDVANISDFHISTISLIENGKQNFSIGWIVHYCNVLEIDPAEIFLRAFKEDFQAQQLNRMYERFGPYDAKKDDE